MSYADVVSRVSQIQGQLAALNTAFDPATAASATQSTTSPSSTGQTFAATLQQAQGVGMSTGVAGTSASLPAAAAGKMTTGQQQFASRLAADTGLDPGVIGAWLLAEENGSAAASRQAANNNDWLNIGYTDSGTYGSGDSIWSDPTAAADATAGWLKGQNTIPGYGTASGGIQAILSTAGQTPQAQIAAIQNSGWASSGYPSLPGLYASIAG
ncbi:MAG TPA: hypothetical protein VFI54_19615 [Solirubrobacteraceae bacterium]|nr:hypothetical protein [Solirubrobacteraceae bacterium]